MNGSVTATLGEPMVVWPVTFNGHDYGTISKPLSEVLAQIAEGAE